MKVHFNNDNIHKRKDLIDYRLFGDFCRTCRKRRRLTQVEVGEMLGYSGNHISEFERGHVDSLYLGYAYSILFGATIFNYITWCSKNQVDIFTKDLTSCLGKAYPTLAKSYFSTNELSNIYGTVATQTQNDPATDKLKNIYTLNEMTTHKNIKDGLMQEESNKVEKEEGSNGANKR